MRRLMTGVLAAVLLAVTTGCAGPLRLVGDLAIQVHEEDTRYAKVTATNKATATPPTEGDRPAEEENTVTAEVCFGVAPFMLCASGDMGFSHKLIGGTGNALTLEVDTRGTFDANAAGSGSAEFDQGN